MPLTRLGIIPRRCSANPPGEAIPATVRLCAVRPSQLRDTVLPTLVRLERRTLKRGWWNPRKGDGRCSALAQDNTVTSNHWGASPPSPSVLCGHPRHRDATSGAAAPSPKLWEYGATRCHHACCCAPYGLPSAAPWSQCRTTTKREVPTPPPLKPLLDGYRARHDSLPEARFARTTVYSTTLCTIPLQ
jgi:hypothetical protein